MVGLRGLEMSTMCKPPEAVLVPTPYARAEASLMTMLCALPNPVYSASAEKLIGGLVTLRSLVKSNTCIPCPPASETMKA